jgi:uncharacterized membrane protein (UPF0127 family)
MRRTGWLLHNETRGAVVACEVFVADNYFSRLRGLIGYAPLAADTVLWIKPCQQVHTHFLRWSLRVVFMDREMRVVRVCEELRPWRISPWVRGASSVLEFSASTGGTLAEGDQLQMRRGGTPVHVA